ncbi:MAG: VRR-NUC domain-containing protein [Lachnospiraceae bacterium]|nr:VRR-NUC domain-containing protein [Lachnospiraceae bacterium]
MRLKYAKRGEDTEQIKVIMWAEKNVHKYPQLKWLHHIPNGGSRDSGEAIKLKQMGVKRGVSDLHLPFPNGKYHGLYIEMKFGKNTLTKEQAQFLCDMRDAGYCVAVCYDALAAETLIKRYLDLPVKGLIYPEDLENTSFDRDHNGIGHVRSIQPFA